MPRTAALKPEQVPADSKPTLDTLTKNIGFTPNMKVTLDHPIFTRWPAQYPIGCNSFPPQRPMG
jgi:hypothetical protein